MIWWAFGVIATIVMISGVYNVSYQAERNGLLLAGLIILAMYLFG